MGFFSSSFRICLVLSSLSPVSSSLFSVLFSLLSCCRYAYVVRWCVVVFGLSQGLVVLVVVFPQGLVQLPGAPLSGSLSSFLTLSGCVLPPLMFVHFSLTPPSFSSFSHPPSSQGASLTHGLPFLLGLPRPVPLLHLRLSTMVLMGLLSLLQVLSFLAMCQQVAPLLFSLALSRSFISRIFSCSTSDLGGTAYKRPWEFDSSERPRRGPDRDFHSSAEASVRGDLPALALCAFPECFVHTPLNSVTGLRARCCGSAHERILLRLDQCPSVVPPGLLFPVSVSFFSGIGAWAPTELLVSSDMLVGDLAGYVFMVFLECAPLEGVSPPLGVSLPRGASFQL